MAIGIILSSGRTWETKAVAVGHFAVLRIVKSKVNLSMAASQHRSIVQRPLLLSAS